MKRILHILCLLFICGVVFSQSTFDSKSLLTPRTGKQQLVNDFANVLTNDQKQTLESKLVKFDDSTSTQIAVVIIPNLGDFEIADYAVQLGRAWGVGGKEFNNGVVLLVSKEDRKLNISTGYGVEGALPDITASHIIRDVITPNFKGNDYYGGLDRGTDAIIKAVKGEYKAPQGYNKRSKKGVSLSKIIFMAVLILVLLSLFGGGGGRGGSFMSRRGFGPVFFPIGGGGGGWGGGGGGSSGGGGFGGFGGGSFGGGGSSGSW